MEKIEIKLEKVLDKIQQKMLIGVKNEAIYEVTIEEMEKTISQLRDENAQLKAQLACEEIQEIE